MGEFNFWHAPQDPDRPRLPYLPGFSVRISRHAQPSGDDQSGFQQRPELKDAYLRTVTHSEAVVVNPPVDGVEDSSSQAELVITSTIAIGSARGAQIVACTVTPFDGSSEPFEAIAKIYDPLYYNFEHSMGHYPRDCVDEADHDYMVETYAYEILDQTGYTGSSAPKYYGSWTFTLPIVIKGSSTSRPVRLILMERLEGVTLQDSRIQNAYSREAGRDAFHYPQEYRLEILARAMDAHVQQIKGGVNQSDFAGRNIFLVPMQSEKICSLFLPRIVLIDYNNANVRQLSSEQLDRLPPNPAQVFWGQYLWEDVAGWVPDEWKDVEIQQNWLIQRFCGHDTTGIYLPVTGHMSGTVNQKIADANGRASTKAIPPKSNEPLRSHVNAQDLVPPSAPQVKEGNDGQVWLIMLEGMVNIDNETRTRHAFHIYI